jgi:hypothetical protein
MNQSINHSVHTVVATMTKIIRTSSKLLTTLLCMPFVVTGWIPKSIAPLSARPLQAAAADPEELQERARKLREEIDALEQEKRKTKEAEVQAQLQEKQAIQRAKDFYSAVLPILKPDGSTVDEKVEFRPVSKQQDTEIVSLEGALPLGMILEEGELVGTTVVAQVAEGSNACLAGVQVGDVLRAASAVDMQMEAPTWQLLAGGIGVPKAKRMMYVVDKRPFEEVMDALGSNRMDPQGRPVILVVERKRQ